MLETVFIIGIGAVGAVGVFFLARRAKLQEQKLLDEINRKANDTVDMSRVRREYAAAYTPARRPKPKLVHSGTSSDFSLRQQEEQRRLMDDMMIHQLVMSSHHHEPQDNSSSCSPSASSSSSHSDSSPSWSDSSSSSSYDSGSSSSSDSGGSCGGSD